MGDCFKKAAPGAEADRRVSLVFISRVSLCLWVIDIFAPTAVLRYSYSAQSFYYRGEKGTALLFLSHKLDLGIIQIGAVSARILSILFKPKHAYNGSRGCAAEALGAPGPQEHCHVAVYARQQPKIRAEYAGMSCY